MVGLKFKTGFNLNLKSLFIFAASASLSSASLISSSLISESLATEAISVDYEHITATPVAVEQRSKTVLGQGYNYPKGVPALYAYSIIIKPGKKTNWHKYSVPLYVEVVSGSLTVDYGSKGKRTFTQGMSYVEALEWCHQGYSTTNQETALFVLYFAEQKSNHVKPIACSGPE